MKYLTLLTAVLLSFFMTACNLDDIGGYLGSKGDHGGKGDKKVVPCFEFVYPISYIMPDRSVVSGDSKEEIDLAIKAWYREHPDSKAKYTMQYPVDIIFADGTMMTINSNEDMKRAKAKCDGDKGKDRDMKPCFKYIYPISYLMPDGTIITGDNMKEIDMAMKTWYQKHPDVKKRGVIQYPFDIIFEDGTTMTINSQEDMKRAFELCDKNKDKDTDRP